MSAAASLRGSAVLVTGASGFIGGHLVKRLEAEGAEVHAVSRSPRPQSSHQAASGPAARWHALDLADAGRVAALMAQVAPAVVFHLASEVAGARDVARVLPMFHANLATTVNLLTAATATGCRVVLAGSMEEPDLSEAGGAPAVPGSPYAASKAAAALYARMFGALYALPVVHLRVFMVYGPAQRDEAKLVPYTTLSLLRGEAPRLMSGTRLVDWVYVADVVDAFVAAGIAPGAPGRTLDVGTGRLETVRWVVERIARLVGGERAPEFGAVGDRPLEAVRTADPAPARAALGWEPRVPLEEGLRRTVEHYRERLAARGG